ncbi:MAG: MGMT family protein, partial [bacterium]|nr:MGMT family protein [bacterium]
MRANRISLVVPCHRVVKSDGYIGEFGGRQDLKRQLLELEGVKVDKNFRYR